MTEGHIPTLGDLAKIPARDRAHRRRIERRLRQLRAAVPQIPTRAQVVPGLICAFCRHPLGEHPQPDYQPCPVMPLYWPGAKKAS